MMFTEDQPVYETAFVEVISNSGNGSSPLFNPMTPAFDSTFVDEVRMGRFLSSPTQEVTPGFQFSDDGVTWGTPTLLGSYSTTQGWVFLTVYTSTYSYSPKNFVRFGLFVLNEAHPDTKNRTGQAKLSVQFKPVWGRQVASAGFRKVNSMGSASSGAFHPLTEVVAASSFNRVRRTLELAASSGDVSVEAAYQVTNTPDEESTWDPAVAFGSAVTSATKSFGTTFATATLTKRYARFGVLVKNASGSGLEACLAQLRVDLRYVA